MYYIILLSLSDLLFLFYSYITRSISKIILKNFILLLYIWNINQRNHYLMIFIYFSEITINRSKYTKYMLYICYLYTNSFTK